MKYDCAEKDKVLEGADYDCMVGWIDFSITTTRLGR